MPDGPEKPPIMLDYETPPALVPRDRTSPAAQEPPFPQWAKLVFIVLVVIILTVVFYLVYMLVYIARTGSVPG